MRKIFVYIFAVFLSFQCSVPDNYETYDDLIVSTDLSVTFEELVIFLNLKVSDNSYLVVKSIDSVNIFVNNYYWATMNSQAIDTTKVEKEFVDGNFESKQKLNYLVLANQALEKPNLITAGDYSDYLNSIHVLKPGEYACLIESFQVTLNDNSVQKYYPYAYSIFEVKENSRSAFVGEIEIDLTK